MLQFPIDDEPTLIRVELVGNLARACRLALQEVEEADTVEFTVRAAPEGFTVDCSLANGEVFVVGWGQ